MPSKSCFFESGFNRWFITINVYMVFVYTKFIFHNYLGFTISFELCCKLSIKSSLNVFTSSSISSLILLLKFFPGEGKLRLSSRGRNSCAHCVPKHHIAHTDIFTLFIPSTPKIFRFIDDVKFYLRCYYFNVVCIIVDNKVFILPLIIFSPIFISLASFSF